MINCTRQIEFDAAHRVKGHKGKCNNLHGHRYILEVTFSSPQLDSLGMVVDFADIKAILTNWINQNWDHNTILYHKDQELGKQIELHTNQKVYYLNCNPTAENLAKYFLNIIAPTIFKDLPAVVEQVKLYETPNCFVTVVRDDYNL